VSLASGDPCSDFAKRRHLTHGDALFLEPHTPLALGCEINFATLGEKHACAATKGEKVAWNFMVRSERFSSAFDEI
jgi:hypothetical protein